MEDCDNEAVDAFARAMKDKLRYAAEVKGRGGWRDPALCSVEDLVRMMREHVEKGDPVDVGNFAMMIWYRLKEGG